MKQQQNPLMPDMTAKDNTDITYTRADLDQLTGTAMIEFGASWCEYCQAVQSAIAAALERYPAIRHIKIEDGKGQRLGRSYSVKLWPTLILLKDGMEVERMVRPADVETITEALGKVCAD